MARCKLTTMNLRNIRKTREYQCLIIDLVNTGVIGKSAAEEVLGYTIPAGLLVSGGSTPEEPGEEEPGEEELATTLIHIVTDLYVASSVDVTLEGTELSLDDGATRNAILAATDYDASSINSFSLVEPVTQPDKEGNEVFTRYDLAEGSTLSNGCYVYLEPTRDVPGGKPVDEVVEP